MNDLHTTNVALIVMAVVSVLEALVIIGMGVGAFIAYRRVMALAADLESRHVAPLTARANDILDDVKAITTRAQLQAERVDQAISGTMDRVDETAGRVKHNVREQVSRIVGVVHGVRAAVASAVSGNGRQSSRATTAQ
jgi:uncharacterized protein YoxC